MGRRNQLRAKVKLIDHPSLAGGCSSTKSRQRLPPPSRRCGLLWLALAATIFAPRAAAAGIERKGNEWVLDTGLVRKVIRVEAGRLELASFRNLVSGREYVSAAQPSPEVRLRVDGSPISGTSGGWNLIGDQRSAPAAGQWQLDLTVRRESLELVKHYVIYAGTPVIREWVTIRNVGAKPVRIEDPCFLAANLLATEAADLDLSYVTGGGNYNGSQLLKTEPMSPGYSRGFDSQVGIIGQLAGQALPRGDSYGAYLPLLVERNRRTHDGLMAGWDYLGHWTLHAGVDPATGGRGDLSLTVAGFSKMLEPGQHLETPKAFIGAFTGDLEATGNALLDWQYAHLWEFTNDDYFARTRWIVRWSGAWVGVGGTPSGDNWGHRLADDFRYIDLMREAGADILWDDAGWYDQYGSWQAPDWRLTNEYLAKHGMKWLLWFPTFLATPTSRIGQEHPEWLVPGGMSFEQSIRATAEWEYDLLAKSVKAWGNFQWRYDGMPAFSANDTDFLASDQNFRWLLEKFKSTFPDSGVDACHGGGRWISYDLARLAESGEYTDGGVGPYSGYYTSLLIPPDKLHNIVDPNHQYSRPATDRMDLAMNPTWYFDPGEGADVEAIRQDWDLYHYLRAQGVVGRWSHVFRPDVRNDDPVWYFQRMNRDGSKGIIIPKHAHMAPVYFVTARRISGGPKDSFLGIPAAMCQLSTVKAAAIDTGIYSDPIDGACRYYGFGDEVFGPVNFKYQAASGEESFATGIVKRGGARPATDGAFGMAIQAASEPLLITELGLFGRTRDEWRSGADNTGKYRLSVVRADDGAVIATVEIDLAQGVPDRLGFKYARLPSPVRLESVPVQPVVLQPHGLDRAAEYDVRCAKSGYHARRTGADLMEHGLTFPVIQPGELVFLNLPNHPGAGTDHIPPSAPPSAAKRLGTNLGTQGVEVSWEAAGDNNWISYYEILRDGVVEARTARGRFYFDHAGEPGQKINSRYEVRAVDGDGNRGGLVLAQLLPGEPETYRALGGYSPTQGARQWRYEETLVAGPFRPMRWSQLGFEGLWSGSGQARIGRIWMQAGAASDAARVFVVPRPATLVIDGEIRKDPSAENGRTVGVKVMQNDRQIWPASGWAEVAPDSSKSVTCHLAGVPVAAGDSIRFVARRTGEESPDPILWDPIITQSNPAGQK